jgi:cytochrome b6-f complex iron-sulfur subunit
LRDKGGGPVVERRRISRRDFLRYSWAGAGALLLLEGAGASLAALWPRVKAGAFGSKFRIPLRDIPQEVGQIDDTFLNTGKFYLSRLPSGILVMYRKCTHLGCVVPWRGEERSEDDVADQGRFNCPCHGSIYDRYGLVHAGPAPRPLDLFDAEVEGDELVVNTGVIIRRSTFDESMAVKI